MNFKDIAEEYLMAGLNPMPLKENKSPNLPVGHPYLYEENLDYVNFDSKYTSKIGVACGKVSSNLLCIDFDCHQGQNIEAVFNSYINTQAFKFLVTLKKVSVYKTPSGGFHIIFRTETPLKGKVLAKYENGDTMIETRGNGQYIACYPSKGYQFLNGCDILEVSELSNEETEYLLSRTLIYNEFISKNEVTESGEKREWKGEWDISTPDGKFNTEGFEEVSEFLIDYGWSKSTTIMEGKQYWIRPNKLEEDGISATYRDKEKMFYIFTSAEEEIKPLVKNKAYSAFNLLVLLKYNGDWRLAKDELRIKYGMKAFDYKKINEFPINILPNSFQKFIIESFNSLGFSKDYTACSMLCAVATCVGNSVKVKVKEGYIDSPIFWIAIVGSRGANKTHPLANVLKPFNGIEKRSFTKYSIDIDNYNSLSEKAKKKEKKPIFKQTLISDFTIEALQSCLAFNKKGVLLYKDELIGFVNDMNKYKKNGSDEQFFLESFNNGDYTVNRKTQDTLHIENIFINIIGTIQNDVLTSLAKGHTENGLLDRFLFTKSENEAITLSDKEISIESIKWWEDYIIKLHSKLKYLDKDDIKIVNFSVESFEYLTKLDGMFTTIQNDENTSPAMVSYYSKMRTYIKRFALLILIIEKIEDNTIENEISIEQLDKAFAIITYFANTAEGIFNDNEKTNEISDILLTLKSEPLKNKIISLHKMGFSNVLIAKGVKKSKQYVGKILQDFKKK